MKQASAGYLLRVDLSSGCCRRELIEPALLQQHLGGRSLGAALLAEYAGVEPLAPEMPLILSIGPFCGTPIPMSSRCILTSRSPQTGTIFSSSSGGPLALCLLASGLIAVIVQGRAVEPCLLEIDVTGGRLVSAGQLWSKGCVETLAALDGTAAVIGPAGEQMLDSASIETSGGEPFGRGGLGAVMGSKLLKGVVLKTAPAQRGIADPVGFDKALEDLMRLFRASPFLLGPLGIKEQGTAALVDLLKVRGMLPGRGFRSFEGDETCWNAYAVCQQLNPQPGGCHDCLVACKRMLPNGTALPEYEQLALFGAQAGLSDLQQIVQMVEQCHDQGIDPVAVVAAQTGVASLTVKGMELPPYDPRASTGLALAYATSPHGASHLTAWPISSEILRKPVPTDRFSFDGKARVISLFEDMGAAMDSLAICRFAAVAVDLEELASLLTAVSGISYTAADLGRIGQQTILDEQRFNQQCGFTDADDTLPHCFFTESANALPPLDQQRFEQELAAYHRIRGGQRC